MWTQKTFAVTPREVFRVNTCQFHQLWFLPCVEPRTTIPSRRSQARMVRKTRKTCFETGRGDNPPYAAFQRSGVARRSRGTGYPRLEEDLIAALAPERRGSARNQVIAAANVCLNFVRGNRRTANSMFSSEIDGNRPSPGSRSLVAVFSVMVGILTRGQQAGEFKAFWPGIRHLRAIYFA